MLCPERRNLDRQSGKFPKVSLLSFSEQGRDRNSGQLRFLLNVRKLGQAPWLTPVIPALREAKAGGS